MGVACGRSGGRGGQPRGGQRQGRDLDADAQPLVGAAAPFRPAGEADFADNSGQIWRFRKGLIAQVTTYLRPSTGTNGAQLLQAPVHSGSAVLPLPSLGSRLQIGTWRRSSWRTSVSSGGLAGTCCTQPTCRSPPSRARGGITSLQLPASPRGPSLSRWWGRHPARGEHAQGCSSRFAVLRAAYAERAPPFPEATPHVGDCGPGGRSAQQTLLTGCSQTG